MTTVGIWGIGAEGQAAARALHKEQVDVVIADEFRRPRPDGLDSGVRFISGDDALEELLTCSEVIVSPGVPRTHPFRNTLATAGITTTSVTQRWMQHSGGKTIGVTGTKGKSTTATLIGLLLQAAGLKTQVGGNIGVPLSQLRTDSDVTVAELSSYQCASLKNAPRVAVITNLYEDHLTWHGSKRAYWQDKARIAGEGCDVLVCDEKTLASLHSIDAKLPDRVVMLDGTSDSRVNPSVLPKALQLHQNLHNLHLAVLAADSWLSRQITEQEIIDATATFHALPHRLSHVADMAGITWIDDTLSTIPESIIAAAEAFSGEIVLIVGGQDRGINYDHLTEYFNEREPLPQLITIPSNGNRIVADYEATHPGQVHHALNLKDAVSIARQIAKPATTVMLSPGAPSYDNFKNFEQKSAAYIKAIKELEEIPGAK